jgi:hypothetical protein
MVPDILNFTQFLDIVFVLAGNNNTEFTRIVNYINFKFISIDL